MIGFVIDGVTWFILFETHRRMPVRMGQSQDPLQIRRPPLHHAPGPFRDLPIPLKGGPGS